jgi:heat shock protein HslJ
MKIIRLLSVLAILAILAGCTSAPTSERRPAAFRSAVSQGEWALRELAGAPAPTGAGGRRATLRFDTDTTRVSGFGGCNRYFGEYTLDGASLRFRALGMTRMACNEGMTLEQQLGAALEATRAYRLSGGELTLLGESGPVATFVRPTP